MVERPGPARAVILLVEDEALIAMQAEDSILELGLVLAPPCSTIGAGLAALQSHHIDAAVLDVSLNGAQVWPVADALLARSIPFLFCSGAPDTIPDRFRDHPVLRKPYAAEQLQEMLLTLLGLEIP